MPAAGFPSPSLYTPECHAPSALRSDRHPELRFFYLLMTPALLFSEVLQVRETRSASLQIPCYPKQNMESSGSSPFPFRSDAMSDTRHFCHILLCLSSNRQALSPSQSALQSVVCQALCVPPDPDKDHPVTLQKHPLIHSNIPEGRAPLLPVLLFPLPWCSQPCSEPAFQDSE